MNAKQFRKYLDRDGGCVHCGDVETAVPHHRRNRGMGGSVARDVPSNIVSLCAIVNGLLESSSTWKKTGKANGWVLVEGQDPSTTPVFYAAEGCEYLIDDEFNRVEVSYADR